MNNEIKQRHMQRQAKALGALRNPDLAPAMESFHRGEIGPDELAKRAAMQIESSGGGEVHQDALWLEACLDALTICSPSWSK